MKNIKLHTIEVKKEQYKKHLDRLSHIYQNDKDKKKIIQESKSMDKLMAITHRLRQTSNKFRQQNQLQKERLSTSRDWSKVNCSFLPISKKPFQISYSLKQQKFKHEQKEIDKENKQIFFRLIKVKPTIQTHKMSYQFNKVNKMPFLNRVNKTEMDFSSILNSSIIRPQETKKITMRLHNQNEEVLKIRFQKEIKEILNQEKLYFFQVKSSNDNVIESACFSVKELMESEVCIFKKKNQNVEVICVKQLFDDIKTIYKGSFYIEQENFDMKNEDQNFIFFVYPNKKITLIGANIEKKNLKLKGKRGILRQNLSSQEEKMKR